MNKVQKVMILNLIISLILIDINSKPSILDIKEKVLPPHALDQLKKLLVHQLQLIGLPQEKQLLQLKIKDNADHAGHSQQLVHSKVSEPSKKEHSLAYLNNNQLIVLEESMLMKDATEVKWMLLCGMSLITELPQNLNIHTKEK